MGHEISQLDIQDRQLLATNAQSRAATWTEIGEAEITHTIFPKHAFRPDHGNPQFELSRYSARCDSRFLVFFALRVSRNEVSIAETGSTAARRNIFNARL